MRYAIEVQGLVKHFGTTTALAGLDLSVRPGTVLGVLGPNGAGKTTAVRILATLLQPDAGHAAVCGFDVIRRPDEVRRRIGLTGQYASVDDNLTGRENLALIGSLLDLGRRRASTRASELLAQFDLEAAADRPVKTYSGGMRRRLDLAASLVAQPAVIFLDEPTTGLDPHKREEVWAMIRVLTAGGSTVLLTTQYLDEADALADEIVVIDAGRAIAHGTPPELKRLVGRQTLRVRPADAARMGEVGALLHEVTGQTPTTPGIGELAVRVDGDAVMTRTVALLAERGIGVTELALHLPGLDEVFTALTGHGATNDGTNEEDAA